ncbi:type VI secretion system Vgr family protein [Dyella japonica]|uniref:Type IV secretion protein Rhs n=1 Tax=Dyella japonica A8 TaxID=1217721 RepID=A0A075K3F1_9GAMM|nr:type VI secretion system tip protein TssI/VgrG [Dyella japonica]AIF48227.1 type IV secretion protein Rhs [Dyella japonica A8]
MAHAITLSSDLGDKLLFASMRADEPLGRLFRYELELLSQDDQVNLRQLLGTSMTVKFVAADGYTRYFNGIVIEAAQTGFRTIDKLSYAVYRVTLAPKPWLLTRKVDCRIFVDQSVPDIVRTVLGEIGYGDLKLSLSGNYDKRDYCVQYREDYFNFISRLLEQEGIYYFFTHADGAHTMVLADALGAHARTPSFEKIPYAPPVQQGKRNAASVDAWRQLRGVHATKVQLTDYDPLNPRTSLLATEEIGQAGDCHEISGLEVFDYPGAHEVTATGERYARVQAEARNVQRSRYEGSTNACGMAVGALFELKDFPRRAWNQEYLVIATRIRLAESGYASGDSDGEPFTCELEAIESKLPFRSLPQAIRPTIAGLQTAVVAGDTAEDIAVDKHGRIQVIFHWNKLDRQNGRQSCPVRVASPWAGKSWGAVSIPRVGQEVVVSFLEGDPDRPLIIGSVYNADNPPPYSLPDNKTQSGIKSRSLQGGTDDYNEIRFEDKKGSEELYLHAQKDMREEVENDHFVEISHDETVTVKNDQTETVQHDRKLSVGNDDKLDVTQNATTSVGQTFKLTAGSEIQLVAGASSIVMKSSGEIEIKGVNVKITGDVSVKVEGQVEVGVKAGATMDIGAGASLKVHSDGMLEVNGAAMTTVKGAMLTLNGEGMAKLGGGITMIG